MPVEWIKPSVRLVTGFTMERGVEYCIRNCYQSFDKLGKTNLLSHVVAQNHDSCLEFSEVLVQVDEPLDKKMWDLLKITCQYPYILVFENHEEGLTLFSGNLRAWLNVIDYLLQYSSPPLYKEICKAIYDELIFNYPFLGSVLNYASVLPRKVRSGIKESMFIFCRNIFDLEEGKIAFKDLFPSWWVGGRRVVTHVICSRSCLAQLSRHRRFSLLVESQRFVRYASKVRCIDPSFRDDLKRPEDVKRWIEEAVEASYKYYACLLGNERPQVARLVLPNIVACSIMVCGSINEYKHFVALRDSDRADREIAFMARELKRVFRENGLM